MPTARPRYQVTDTGRTRALLDRAAGAWPDLAGDRKALLLRLAETGAEHLPDGGASKADLSGFAGMWVALARDTVLVADAEVGAVVRWLRERDVRAEQLYRVPAADDAVAAEHGLT